MTDPLRCPCCDREVFQPGEDGLYKEGIEVVCKCGAKCRVGVDGSTDAGDADGVAYVEVDAPDPEWTSADGTLTLYRGDCVEVMRAMPEASVDAIVCDPPYALTGNSRGGSPRTNDPETPFGRHRLQGKASSGFMGQRWDAELPSVEMWREALRVAKPGAHLLAFGGTRTFHRLTCAIEDAGWEIRDCLMWLYGTGFPKSLDVSKAIDKALGAKREVVGTKRGTRGADGTGHEGRMPGKAVGIKQVECEVPVTAPATDEAKRFAGWGTALRPCWEPIVLARKPPEGTVAANAIKYGTGGINIDGCRIPRGDKSRSVWPARDGAVDTGLHGKVRGGADDANPDGGWPGNILLTHAPECRLVGTRKVSTGTAVNHRCEGDQPHRVFGDRQAPTEDAGYADTNGKETVEVWECVPDCPVRLLDVQSGMTATKRIKKPSDCGGNTWGGTFQIRRGARGHTDSGGASRFFSQLNFEEDEIPCRFKYTSKASRSERDDGCDEIEPVTGATAAGRKDGSAGAIHPRAGITSKVVRNIHPTTKPLAVMDWLVKLVTPPGGVVLDPFVGSGTTMVACAVRGVRCVGIDLEPSYARIAVARVRRAREKTGTLAASEAKAGQQLGLLAVAPPTEERDDARQRDGEQREPREPAPGPAAGGGHDA